MQEQLQAGDGGVSVVKEERQAGDGSESAVKEERQAGDGGVRAVKEERQQDLDDSAAQPQVCHTSQSACLCQCLQLQQAMRCWFESCQVEVVPLERCHTMECFTLPAGFNDCCVAECAFEETVRTDEGLVQLFTGPLHMVSSCYFKHSHHNT